MDFVAFGVCRATFSFWPRFRLVLLVPLLLVAGP